MTDGRAIPRRDFVKLGVAAGAVATLGGAGVLASKAKWGDEGRLGFDYWGAKKTAGPAPRAVPLVPLMVNSAGELEGVPKLEGVNPEHGLHWYRYCNHDAAPGLSTAYEGDNRMRYHNQPNKLATAERELGEPLWYADRIGQVARAQDFKSVGDGAMMTWRSDGQTDTSVLVLAVVRIDVERLPRMPPPGFLVDDLVGLFSACTHFCCTPGYRESKIPLTMGRFDELFCTCHDSSFDPHDLVVDWSARA